MSQENDTPNINPPRPVGRVHGGASGRPPQQDAETHSVTSGPQVETFHAPMISSLEGLPDMGASALTQTSYEVEAIVPLQDIKLPLPKLPTRRPQDEGLVPIWYRTPADLTIEKVIQRDVDERFAGITDSLVVNALIKATISYWEGRLPEGSTVRISQISE